MTAFLRSFLLILLVGLAAACSGDATGSGIATLASGAVGASSAAPSSSPATDPAEAFRAYTACMRENGVDMPDAEIVEGGPGGGGGPVGFAVGGSQPDDADFQKADAACQHHLSAIIQERPNTELSPEDEEKLLQFARCMREHGIDMPDPGANGGAAIRIGPGDDAFDMEEFEAAQEACAEFAPGFIERRGSSDGGGGADGGPAPGWSIEESR